MSESNVIQRAPWRRLVRRVFSALTLSSALVFLGICCLFISDAPGNFWSASIGLWSGGNGWVPLWIIVLASLMLPIIWLAIRRRSVSLRLAQCRQWVRDSAIYRPARYAWSFFTVLSVLLCMVTAVFWVRSYRAPASWDLFQRAIDPEDVKWGWHVRSEEGMLFLSPFFSFYHWNTAYWQLLLLFLILPLGHLVNRWLIKARLKRAGHCPVCNYDLRATPNRCPECGTQVGADIATLKAGSESSPSAQVRAET